MMSEGSAALRAPLADHSHSQGQTAQPKSVTSATHMASHWLFAWPPQQKGSGATGGLAFGSPTLQTQFWIAATEQPTLACAVQQVPTFPPAGPQIPLVHVPLQH